MTRAGPGQRGADQFQLSWQSGLCLGVQNSLWADFFVLQHAVNYSYPSVETCASNDIVFK